MRIFLIQGFRLFDSSIDIVLTFEFGHTITLLKMAIFHKVDYIEIEPAHHYHKACIRLGKQKRALICFPNQMQALF